MAYYQDLREHITALEAAGKLVRITRPINKDTELMPLVRWQFRGLPESERKAFLFENVTDSQNRAFAGPVLVASHAASVDVYAIGMQCKPEEIQQKWMRARQKPIPPVTAQTAPVQEEVYMGADLLKNGGLMSLPIPISTPGLDNAPYISAGNWISKDPENGVRNIGNYRGMIKAPDRVGIMLGPNKDLRVAWEKSRKMGLDYLPVAIVIGPVPAIGYCATVRFPYDVDEFAVAGGIAGEAIPMVKCKTVDLEVPANAEIVIEGRMPTGFMEREGPFGEFTGFMVSEETGPYVDVTCITHRHNPIVNAFISQFPPSESSTMRRVGEEANLYKFLHDDCGLPVTGVAFHEACSSVGYCVVSLKKGHHPSQAWQALNGVVTQSAMRKFIVAVDEDIDARNADSVNWAMSWRVQPARDIRVIKGMIAELDPSLAPPGKSRKGYPVEEGGASAVLINATAKWPYPPLSLPTEPFMAQAKAIWEAERLPQLTPAKPWHSADEGYWTDEIREEAKLAVEGNYFETGEKLKNQRIKVDD